MTETSPDLKIFVGKCSLMPVRSGFFGFRGENPPTDPPFMGFGGEDLPPIVTRVGSVGSLAGSNGYCGWVRYRFSVDSLLTITLRL